MLQNKCQKIQKVRLKFDSNQGPWSKESWSVVTIIHTMRYWSEFCTWCHLNQSKELEATSVDFEGNLKSQPVQNQASKDVSVCTKVNPAEIRICMRKLNNRKVYKYPSYEGEKENSSHPYKKIKHLKKDSKLHTLNSADRVQEWINIFFTYGKFVLRFLSNAANIIDLIRT